MYALGCTLFHLIAGKPPFRGRDPLSKLASHAGERIPSLESAGVPSLVEQALTGMMTKDPDRRYQHPRQVVDVLTQVLEKLEPAQLKWRASAISNKLPEYEAWLQPYRLAPETAKNEIPEISMPPILAAGLPSQQPEPTDMFITFGHCESAELCRSGISGRHDRRLRLRRRLRQSGGPTTPSSAVVQRRRRDQQCRPDRQSNRRAEVHPRRAPRRARCARCRTCDDDGFSAG